MLRIFSLLIIIFLMGCGLMSRIGLYPASSEKKSSKQLEQAEKEFVFPSADNFVSPCVNIPFIDRYSPELLSEVVEITQPYVPAYGAARVLRRFLKARGKGGVYEIQWATAKSCGVENEQGFLFNLQKTSIK